MYESDSWPPSREQDLADLCKKWDNGLNNPAVVTAFGWNQAYVTAASTGIDGFLTARDTYIDTGTRRRIIVYYKDEKSARRGKPKGGHGIEIRWAVLDHVPTDISELVNSSFDTNPPLTLVFEKHDRGKRIYLCGCWEIEREGEKGPFGAIEEAIIP
jgi:hypothetical protein